MPAKAKTQRTSTSTISADPVTRYASEVVAGSIIAGPFVRLACKRHLLDLKQGPKRGLKWDVDAAIRAIKFFPDILRLAEGEYAGKPFVLGPWQQFIIGSLFGWKAPDGYRRFRTAYVEIGKGNGKSPMAGGVGLYMLAADREAGAECYAAATTREQANILFQDAVKMVDASPSLTARIHKSGNRTVFNLAHLASGSFFRPISSEGKGLDGKRVHYAALDEVHEHPSAIVVDKMRAGTKGRRQALIFEITNSGYDRESVCWSHHEFSRHILEGTLENDSWFAYICGLDQGDDWRNPKVWIKANPNLGVSIPNKYLQEQVDEAVGMPSKENIVKRLNFCIWTEGEKRWMPPEAWDSCSELSVDEAALAGESCIAALDLSLTRDLSALVLTFPPTEQRRHWAFLPYFWIPEDDAKERIARDHVPYDVWTRQQKVFVTPGNVTDHDFIETKIIELSKVFKFLELAYDPSRAVQLVTHLQAYEINLVEFPQTCKMFNAGVQMMEKLFMERLFGHGSHPVLRWNFSNCVTVPNSNGEVKFDKGKAKTGRIDGMVAAAMGVSRAILLPPGPGRSIFEGDEWKSFYN
jgi:phage terminase large subunit-like protein